MKNLAVVLFILLIVVAWMGAKRTEPEARLPSVSAAEVVPAPSRGLPARLPQPREHSPADFAGPPGLPQAAPYVPPSQMVETQDGTPPLSPDEQKAVYESMHSAQPNDEDDEDW